MPSVEPLSTTTTSVPQPPAASSSTGTEASTEGRLDASLRAGMTIDRLSMLVSPLVAADERQTMPSERHPEGRRFPACRDGRVAAPGRGASRGRGTRRRRPESPGCQCARSPTICFVRFLIATGQ